LSVVCGATLAACTLDASGTRPTPGESSVPATGAGGAAGAGAGGAAGAGGVARAGQFCDPNRNDLIGCYLFDGNTRDASPHGNHAAAQAITFSPGVDGSALTVDGNSVVRIPDSPSWELAAATIEMWVAPAAIPVGNDGDEQPRAGLLDKDGQCGVFLLPAGRVSCIFGGATATGGSLTVGDWTHVACTANNSTVTLHVNGVAVVSAVSSAILHTFGAILIGANSPFGDPLDGSIDNLRIWASVRTQEEICAAASPRCP
jgi:hypothetical protein